MRRGNKKIILLDHNKPNNKCTVTLSGIFKVLTNGNENIMTY